jgi:sulfur transfer protein SufE
LKEKAHIQIVNIFSLLINNSQRKKFLLICTQSRDERKFQNLENKRSIVGTEYPVYLKTKWKNLRFDGGG